MSGKYDGAVFGALDKFWINNHYPPTVRDLQDACGVSSTSVVADVLRRLERNGHIVLRGKCSRPIPLWISDLIDEHVKEALQTG